MTAAVAAPATSLSVSCQMEHLLAAVGAVTPHVGKESDGGGADRARLVVDTTVMRLYLLATSPTASVVAMVPLEDADEPVDGDGETIRVAETDLSRDALKAVSAVLSKTEAERARVDLHHVLADHEYATAVQVTDTTGLLPGRTIRVRSQAEWVGDGEERRDAARTVLGACTADLAAGASVVLSADRMRPWLATGRAIGVLPVRVTTAGHMVLVAGGGADALASGLTVIGAGYCAAALEAGTGQPAYDGPATTELMSLLLDGEPAGGDPARDREHRVVTEIQEWLAAQAPTTSTPDSDGDGGDGGGAPEGGEAA